MSAPSRLLGWADGRRNIAAGLFAMALFMAYGFVLIYLRDFHPDKEAWIAQYGLGKHFELRLAHVHGNLLAFMNIMLGFVLRALDGQERGRAAAGVLGVLGLLMPAGIMAEVYLGWPPYPVLVGALSMVASYVVAGVLWLRQRPAWTPQAPAPIHTLA